MRQRCHGLAQVAVLEAVGQHPEGEQGGEQGLGAGVAEAQRRGALPIHDAWPVEVAEPLCSDEAVVADALDAQQASVGGEADPFQIIEVFQPSAVDAVGKQCQVVGAGTTRAKTAIGVTAPGGDFALEKGFADAVAADLVVRGHGAQFVGCAS